MKLTAEQVESFREVVAVLKRGACDVRENEDESTNFIQHGYSLDADESRLLAEVIDRAVEMYVANAKLVG